MKYLLDTCAWLDAILKPELLSLEAREVIESSEMIGLSQISAFELARKEALGKILLNMPVEKWLRDIALPPGKIKLLNLETAIVIDATRLPEPFTNRQGKPHKDPADQLIVATARHHKLTLLTSDQILLDYASVSTIKSRR